MSATVDLVCVFSRNKLIKANKCLHVLRCLRKEGHNHKELDPLFYSLVLPNITYGLFAYGAAVAELTSIQAFLDRCFKRKYISIRLDINKILEQQDIRLYKKAASSESHPLYSLIPKPKSTRYNLRYSVAAKPKIYTSRFMNTFFNRLLFKYDVINFVTFFTFVLTCNLRSVFSSYFFNKDVLVLLSKTKNER